MAFIQNSKVFQNLTSHLVKKMTTVKITIDDSLPFSDLKTVLSLIRGIAKVEVAEYSDETDKKEYEQLKNIFLNGSKHSMSQHVSKYLYKKVRN